jgi:hypothetical protein
MQVEIDLVNSLMCDRHEAQVMLNGVVVGIFTVLPGQTHISQSYMFPAQPGPSYALRYETTRTVAMGCGGIDYSQMSSTVSLGN